MTDCCIIQAPIVEKAQSLAHSRSLWRIEYEVKVSINLERERHFSSPSSCIKLVHSELLYNNLFAICVKMDYTRPKLPYQLNLRGLVHLLTIIQVQLYLLW